MVALVATVSAFLTVGFGCEERPTVNHTTIDRGYPTECNEVRYGENRAARPIPVFAALVLCGGVAAAAQHDLAAKSTEAKQAMDARRFAEAAAIYRELVAALPENPGLHMDLGLALHMEGKYREAADQFQAAVRRDPGMEPAWLLLGLTYRKLDEPQKAVEPLERAVKLRPDDRRAQLELADADLSVGRATDAAEGFGALTKADPQNPKAWQGLGLSYAALGRQSFSELEKIAPGSAYRDALLGRSLFDQHQDRSAFYWYRQALAQDRRLPGAHAALAEIYRRSGHNDWAPIEEERERQIPAPACSQPDSRTGRSNDALECDFLAGRFSEIVSRRTASPEVHYWQARAYGELSHQAFDRLTALPPSPEIHELMAEALIARGNYHGAVNEWNEALKLARGDTHLEQGLAHALWLDNDLQNAKPLLLRLVQSDPESAELNFELGDVVLQVGSTGEAIPYLEKATRLDPQLAPAQAALGRAYLRSGRPREAVTHLKAALPSDEKGSSLYQLAQAYRQTGQADLANQAMREFERTSSAALARTQRKDQEREITAP